MKWDLRIAWLGLALAVLGLVSMEPRPAFAQALVNPCTLYEGTKDPGNTTQNCIPVTAAAPLPVTTTGSASSPIPVSPNPYPVNAVPITASATGTTAATAATLAGAASKTTYICGFSIRANATAATTANSTVAGTVTGTLNYTQWTAPNASGLGIIEQIFSPCIPASAANTGVVVTSAAPGAGGVVSVSAWGYQL